MKTKSILLVIVLSTTTILTFENIVLGATPEPPSLEIAGDWSVRFRQGTVSATFEVDRPEIVRVADEKLAALPVYNEKGPAYNRGACLSGVFAQECSVCGALDPAGVVVRDEKGEKTFQVGRDYKVDAWGRIGRLADGEIAEKQPVLVTYEYAKMRLDSIVLPPGGAKPELRRGTSHVSIPEPPGLKDGEKRLANIWIYGNMSTLTDESLFPVLADRYPEPKREGPGVAEKLLPKTLKKLRAGEKVRILAWGDSVTAAGYIPDDEKWQEQFVRRLRKAYPDAEIVLVSEAWGGRNTSSYFAEPPGSVHNYKEKVLDVKPDLVVMEFVNDAWLSGEALFKQYDRILGDFKEIGAEWIILTPHYVRPDWMGIESNKNIDDDPRPYVKSIREFGEKRSVAVADGAKRYGHLWRQGIPYITLMMNNINHPNGYGMSLFADALMELF